MKMIKAFENNEWDQSDLKIVCRNLWNFYKLNYYDKKLFDFFSEIIFQSMGELSDLDTANAL